MPMTIIYNLALRIHTSQHTCQILRQRFADQQVRFAMISDMGYRELMHLYDPPKEVIYKDIALNKSDDTEQLTAVSNTLNSVRADDMLAYIVQQAYRIKSIGYSPRKSRGCC